MNNNLIESIKGLLTKYGFIDEKTEPEYNSIKLSDQTITQIVGELEIEKEIFRVDEETGTRVPLENGEYMTEDKKFSVEDGKIVVIKERFNEYKTPDGTVLKVDGELSVGNSVMVVTEDGEVPAPDGQYILEDETKFYVEDGVITKIGEEEEPENPEEMPENEDQKILDMLKNLLDSFNSQMKKVSDEFNEFKSEFQKLKSDYNEFKKLPAGNPIKDTKTEEFESDNKTNNRIAQIMSIRNKK